MRNFRSLFVITALFSTFLASQVKAGGLDLSLYYGTRHIAMGGTQIALANDAYATMYNPAGLSFVDSRQIAFNSMNLIYSYEAPIGAANAQRRSDVNFAPLFYLGYASMPIWERLSFGFAVFPTALQGGKFSRVNYGAPNISDREFGNRLVRIEISPSAALKLNEYMSVGLAYKMAYNRYDKQFGSNVLLTYFDSSVDCWNFTGLKLAAMVHRWNGLSLAVTWRLENQIDLGGTTKIVSPLHPTGTSVDTEQTVKIPAQLQVGLAYEFTPRWTGAFTYEFTQNSVIEDDTSRFSAPVTILPAVAIPGTSVPLRYKDGHGFHVGTDYLFNLGKDSSLRTGVGMAIDTAVTRESNQIPALPPANHYVGWAMGAQYTAGHHIYGLAINYGEYEDTTDRVDPAITPGVVFPGKNKLQVFLASVDYQYKF